MVNLTYYTMENKNINSGELYNISNLNILLKAYQSCSK